MVDDTALLTRRRSLNAANRLSVAFFRLALLVKANPNWHLQPRVPAGRPAGGRWTSPFFGAAAGLLPVLRHLAQPALRRLRDTLRLMRPVLRRLPRGWGSQTRHPRDEEFDDESKRIGPPSWHRHGYPTVRFQNERELRTWLGPAGPGREWHHIVEKRLAENGTFPAEWIHNTDNIINLPVEVHRRVSVSMSSRGDDVGGDIRRYWVGRLSYEKQYNYGLKLIRRTMKDLGHDTRTVR